MQRILYFSTARADLTQAEVDSIVDHAREANAKRNVTGALAYNGRNFGQVLEGDADVLKALLDIIGQDPRHSGFKILDQKDITSRHFPDWAMYRVNDLDFQVVIDAMKT